MECSGLAAAFTAQRAYDAPSAYRRPACGLQESFVLDNAPRPNIASTQQIRVCRIIVRLAFGAFRGWGCSHSFFLPDQYAVVCESANPVYPHAKLEVVSRTASIVGGGVRGALLGANVLSNSHRVPRVKARVQIMRTKKAQSTKGASGTARLFCGASCVPSRVSPARRRPASRILWRMAAMLLVLLVVGSSAWGQATTSVRGTIVDPSGKAVAGASVVLANSESKTERATTTGEQGEYQFLLVPPGTYKLTVTASGFRRYEQTDLQLLVNTPATANAQLTIGGTSETVTVTSEAPAINLVDASIGNSFDEVQVSQLPLEGRNVPDLLSLQAGVAYTGNRIGDKDQDTRNGAVNGARSDQSNVTLDGVDVNDQSNGYAFTSVLPVTQDSIQEFRVTTTNYGADQGQGSGAQVTLVTKSGTNAFHGSAYEYIRNTITSANDYLVKQSELNIGDPNKPLQLNRNIFGASVGGPLRKDRLFFFANYEGTREREQQRAERVIPTPTMCQGIFRYVNVNGGLTTLMPSDLKTLDPRGIGIDPAMLDLVGHTGYLDKTFCTGRTVTNDISAGDGFNYAGFVFRAPKSHDNDVFIARVDYRLTSDGRHLLFWRGASQDLRNPGTPFLPGGPPQQTTSDHSKGFAVGYTTVLSPTLTN